MTSRIVVVAYLPNTYLAFRYKPRNTSGSELAYRRETSFSSGLELTKATLN